MLIYELLVFDAEDSRDFAYHAERLFFSSPEKAEEYFKAHFPLPNFFYKVKGYTLDEDSEAVMVAGNWSRPNLVDYYNAKTS